jgi:hypothetical protein
MAWGITQGKPGGLAAPEHQVWGIRVETGIDVGNSQTEARASVAGPSSKDCEDSTAT